MAKILLGPTVIGIRGTVGGVTFSQNRGGPYARGWHTPPNPRANKQLTQRGVLASWATSWRTLTAAQQATWNTYAAAPAQQLTDSLGQPYFASGLNWYITTNINRAHIGAAAVLVAPVGARPGTPVIENFIFRDTPAVGTTRVQFTAGSPPLALNHAVWAIVVNSLGILIRPAVTYLMTVAVPNASRQISFQTELETKFGNITLAQKCFIKTYAIGADGQSSATVYAAANAQNP